MFLYTIYLATVVFFVHTSLTMCLGGIVWDYLFVPGHHRQAHLIALDLASTTTRVWRNRLPAEDGNDMTEAGDGAGNDEQGKAGASRDPGMPLWEVLHAGIFPLPF